MGGLSEKANVVSQVWNNAEGRVIGVDAGNLLFAKPGRFTVNEPQLITAQAVAEIYLLLGLDALAVGSDDLAAGLEFVKKSEALGLPWISANLLNSEGQTAFAPFVVKEIDDLSVAIVGITGEPMVEPIDFVIKDGTAVLAELLPELENEHDLIVLLAALKIPEVVELVEKFSQIDIAVAADNSRNNVVPFFSGTTLITQTGTRGRYQGILTIDWNGNPLGKKISDELLKHRKRQKSLSQQLHRLQANPWDAAAKTEKIKQLQTERDKLTAQIEELEAHLASGKENQMISTFEHRFLPLANTGRKNPQIDNIIRDAKKRIAAQGNR